MSVFKMSNEALLNFIELYRNEECLWLPNHDQYKNKEARYLACQKIAKMMKPYVNGRFGSNEVNQKFKNIRSSYCQELKKINNKSNKETGNYYTPKVVWFHKIDSFLRNHVQQRDTTATTTTTTTTTATATTRATRPPPPLQDVKRLKRTLKSDGTIVDHIDVNSLEFMHDNETEQQEVADRSTDSGGGAKSPSSPPPPASYDGYAHSMEALPQQQQLVSAGKRVLSDTYCTTVPDAKKYKIVDDAFNVSSASIKEDEYATFGTYVASQLRSLSLRRSESAKCKIQQILSTERINDMDTMDNDKLIEVLQC